MEHLHQESKVNIGPTTGTFAPGFQVENHWRMGTEYDNEVSHMSDECKKAAVVFGLKFTLKDASVGAQAVETLNQLKEMAMSVDQVKEVVDRGLDISFRHEDKVVWCNVVVPESLEELKGLPGWDKVDMSKCVFSGKANATVTSGADPTKFLTATFDDIVERLSHFCIEGEGNFEELHHVITAVTGFAKEFFGCENKKVNMVLAGLNLATAFKSLNFDFKYDPTVVNAVAKNFIQATGKLDKIQEKLSGNQEMATGFLPQAQMMAPMFVGPYTDLLKSVDLGHYQIFVMVPRLRLHWCPGFTLFGLDGFLNENFLNQ